MPRWLQSLVRMVGGGLGAGVQLLEEKKNPSNFLPQQDHQFQLSQLGKAVRYSAPDVAWSKSCLVPTSCLKRGYNSMDDYP